MSFDKQMLNHLRQPVSYPREGIDSTGIGRVAISVC